MVPHCFSVSVVKTPLYHFRHVGGRLGPISVVGYLSLYATLEGGGYWHFSSRPRVQYTGDVDIGECGGRTTDV
jgi:hypothetical protein